MKTRRFGTLLFSLLLAGSSFVGAFVAPVRYGVPSLRSNSVFGPGILPRGYGLQTLGGPSQSALGLSAPRLSGSLLLPRSAAPAVKEAPFASAAPLSFGFSAGQSAARSLNFLAQTQPGGFDASAWVFDRSGRGLAAGAVPSGEQPAGPKLPPGVTRVSVDVVRTAADVERLIPKGTNSNGLRDKLKKTIKDTAPFYVYKYFDAKGGSFTAIDLSAKPELVKHVPELWPHEIDLIRKIQVWNLDLQILVREDGKTPDLVVGGLVTELKSHIGHEMSLTALVEKANEQVLEHGLRHGLGHGAAAVDLVGKSNQVSVEELTERLSEWGRTREKLVLDKIFVFRGDDLKVFVRRNDGSFGLGQNGMPFRAGGAPNPFTPDAAGPLGFTTLDFGRSPAWTRQKWFLERLAEEKAGQRVAKQIEKFAAAGRGDEAAAVWKKFAATHSEPVVRLTNRRISRLLPGLDLGR